MPQAIGAAIFAIGGTAGVAAGATAVAGTTLASIVGSTVLSGVLIGAQLLLAPKPDIPKPQDGALVLKQSIPPAIYGYGRARNGGAYLAYKLKGSTSYDIIGLHQGRVDGFDRWYLHDDPVAFEDGADDGAVHYGTTKRYRGDPGEEDVKIYWRKGLPTETPYAEMMAAFPAFWTADHRGDGMATAELLSHSPDVKAYPRRFPYGLPQLSVVGRWQLCWDPRDQAQSPDDPDSWTWTVNPVRQLLHFYCHCPAGYRRPVSRVYQPAAGWWLAAMDLCDEPVQRADDTFEPRYAAGGMFDSDTPRKSVVDALLRSFDGWIAERGDGAIVIYGGAYYEPSITVEDQHIYNIRTKRGRLADERITRLNLKVSSPDHNYNDVDIDPWMNQAEIDAGARVVARPVQAEWCQSYTQMRRLAKIEFDRARCKIRGTMLLRAFGENLRGRRFFMLNSREQMSTRMIPCEVVDFHDSTFVNGAYEVEFQSVDPARYDWDRMTEEGRRPTIPARTGDDDLPIPPLPTLQVVRETVSGATVARISSTSPPVEGWSELTLTGRYRKVGTSSWQAMTAPDEDLQVLSDPIADGAYEVENAYVGGKGSRGDWSSSETISLVSDNIAPAAPVSIAAVDMSDRVAVTTTMADSLNILTQRIYRGVPGDDATSAIDVSGELAATPGQSRTWLDAGVSDGEALQYWARAFNGSAVGSGFAGPARIALSSAADDAIDRMTVKPSAERATALRWAVARLQMAGVWDKLDALYFLAAHDEQAAYLNLRQDAFDLTKVGSGGWTADRGWQGDGATNYLDTGFTPSTAGGKFALNDALLGVYGTPLSPGVASSWDIGVGTAAGGTTYATIGLRNNLDKITLYLNSGSTSSVAIGAEATPTFVAVSRSASNSMLTYKDGDLVFTDNDASVMLPVQPIYIGARSNSSGAAVGLTNRPIHAAVIGGNLSAPQHAELAAALSEYMQSVGVA
ncbi:hypothetical protein [Hansschlegelia plantiphila]|uniref:Tip attachment protein J domain-containing protein n=1 Tax=Hansschlegelia plantiphila TaxID=374655 RepID=A0A9W6MUS6_9HYPH|nr:hypothetical protein [Hansschlegelia plantiphila]GLK67000.1 hypothetical protein GCM10008179_06380 [Hansschlegelia plantiphila]